MKKVVFSIILLFTIRFVNAQTDSTLIEIMNANSRSSLISKSRKMLLEKFIDGDIEKVKELEDYLSNKLANDMYVALYSYEQIIIKYWTKDYETLIPIILLDHPHFPNYNPQIYPKFQDNIYSTLLVKTKNEKDTIFGFINNASISQEDKDFLIMYLLQLLKENEDFDLMQNTLNAKAEDFLIKYSGSKYEEYIRYQIREKYILQDWGFGCSFFIGSGWYTRALGKHFISSFGIGLNADATYKNFLFFVNGFWSTTGTKDSLIFNNINWKKDSQTDANLFGGNFGYLLANNKRFALAPFIGLSSYSIKASDYSIKENPEYNNIRLKPTLTYNCGFFVDIRIMSLPNLTVYNQEQFFFNLRISYAYIMPHFEKNHPGFNGNMHNITIGIGYYGKGTKREY